jgi:hypothetical protein
MNTNMDNGNTPSSGEPARIPVGKLVFGLALLTVGTLVLTDALDVWEQRELWQYWPVVLIALGVANEIDTLRARKGDGGFILIAIGVWMLAATREYRGLDYVSAFPLAIAVAGLGIIIHALLGIDGRCRKENRS